MAYIELKQKKLLKDLILKSNFKYTDFFIDKDKEDLSYTIHWSFQPIAFRFTLYYLQIQHNECINCLIHNGSEKHPNKNISINLNEIENYFLNWLNDIEDYNEFLLSTHLLDKEFSYTINKISENFQEIYCQSLLAEHYHLNEIAGMGYRKAFEFLLKDYLIYRQLITIEYAQSEFKLQNCIEKLIENEIIKSLATHIGYLGNDFSHYYRKWVDKEIVDLKEGINILVEWIDTTETYKKNLEFIESKSNEFSKDFK